MHLILHLQMKLITNAGKYVMKELLKKFLKDKFNIALSIIQIIAIVFVCLAYLSPYMLVIALVLESVFFLVWGIKVFHGIKVAIKNLDNMGKLPFSQAEIALMKKRAEYDIKGNKSRGVFFIIASIVLMLTIILSFI